jgi:hypothetical protein
MPLSSGAKIHVTERRAFEADIRAHFIGEVEAIANGVARARGWAFVFNTGRNEYVRSRHPRIRLVPLNDARLVIRVLPPASNVEAAEYRFDDDQLFVTDGVNFEIEINDFGAMR